jgi:phosphatidylserine/phosphatidylglycerophosphate/cardiolipin synthase-like enzyme
MAWLSRSVVRMTLVAIATTLPACFAVAEIPPEIKIFFGPKAADDPQSPYANLLKFLDSAKTSIYGSVHEVDLVSVAERLARRADEKIDVQLVIENDWWKNAKNKAARQVLEKSKVRVFLDTKKSGLMHNKFFIVDNVRVWTGSTNLTETCMLFNPNNAVWVENKQVAANFFTEFDEQRQGKFGKKGSGKNNTPFPDVKVGNVRVRTYFSPEDEPMKHIIAAIDKSQKSIDVMCFVFSSPEICAAMKKAHQRGVKVRVLLDNLFSSPGATARWPCVPFNELKEAGVECKYDDEDSKLHHKVVIIDGKIVVTGSYNLSTNAATENDENVLLLESTDVADLYSKEFERLWKYYSGDPGVPPPLEKGDEDGV